MQLRQWPIRRLPTVGRKANRGKVTTDVESARESNEREESQTRTDEVGWECHRNIYSATG